MGRQSTSSCRLRLCLPTRWGSSSSFSECWCWAPWPGPAGSALMPTPQTLTRYQFSSRGSQRVFGGTNQGPCPPPQPWAGEGSRGPSRGHRQWGHRTSPPAPAHRRALTPKDTTDHCGENILLPLFGLVLASRLLEDVGSRSAMLLPASSGPCLPVPAGSGWFLVPGRRRVPSRLPWSCHSLAGSEATQGASLCLSVLLSTLLGPSWGSGSFLGPLWTCNKLMASAASVPTSLGTKGTSAAVVGTQKQVPVSADPVTSQCLACPCQLVLCSPQALVPAQGPPVLWGQLCDVPCCPFPSVTSQPRAQGHVSPAVSPPSTRWGELVAAPAVSFLFLTLEHRISWISAPVPCTCGHVLGKLGTSWVNHFHPHQPISTSPHPSCGDRYSGVAQGTTEVYCGYTGATGVGDRWLVTPAAPPARPAARPPPPRPPGRAAAAVPSRCSWLCPPRPPSPWWPRLLPPRSAEDKIRLSVIVPTPRFPGSPLPCYLHGSRQHWQQFGTRAAQGAQSLRHGPQRVQLREIGDSS